MGDRSVSPKGRTKMFRRQFVQFMATLGASSVATLAAADAKGMKSVTYVVKGFSCATCAVGLDTMLGKRKGILRSKSSYPDGIVRIQFDPEEVAESELKDFIGEMGFTVAEERTA
jgi:copper chaperone CopZ